MMEQCAMYSSREFPALRRTNNSKERPVRGLRENKMEEKPDLIRGGQLWVKFDAHLWEYSYGTARLQKMHGTPHGLPQYLQ